MVKAQEVKLGVSCLLGLQHDLELRPLLADKVGRSLDDVVSLDRCRLEKRGETDEDGDEGAAGRSSSKMMLTSHREASAAGGRESGHDCRILELDDNVLITQSRTLSRTAAN